MVAFGSLIVIALFTALIAPYFVDWASYKKEFELQTSRIVGQKVEVLGETEIRLLPLPSITFGGLAIGRNADKTPMMTVDQFTMDVELMPLLKGDVTIVKLNLVRPKVNIHVDENGEVAWTNRQQLLVDPEQIKLENFTIINGEVKVHGLVGGRTLSLEQLDGRISAKSLFGPWHIGADGYIGANRARIDLVTGHLQDDGSIRVKLSAKRADLPYKLSLDGPVKVADGLLRWDGEFELVGLTAQANGGQEALPIFSQGKFGAVPHLIEVPEFRLEIGGRDDPYTITGSGLANIDEAVSFKIKADGRQIDLDRVGDLGETNSQNGGLGLEQRLNVLRSIIEKIPVPTAQGTIDLALPAIVAGDTLIRDVRAEFSPDLRGWKVQRLEATLPGNTKFEAVGKVGLHEAFGFTGKMVVASRQPTGLAAWLGKRNNPFIRKLHSAGFSADVVISNNQSSLENLELILDAAKLEGKLQRLTGSNGRPALVAALEGDQINLDDLRAIFALFAEDDAKAFTNHDLDISLKAGKLLGFDISAENFETRFRVKGGSVSVEKLNATNFFGAELVSSGRIDDLLKSPNGKFDLSIKAGNPGKLLQFVQSKIPDNKYLANLARFSNLAKNLDLEFTINARSIDGGDVKGSRGQALVKGEFGGTKVNIETEFSGKIDDIGSLKLEVVSTLDNDNPTRLMLQLGLGILPLDMTGSMSLASAFTGTPKDGFAGDISAFVSGSNFKFEGVAYPTGVKSGDAKFRLVHSSKDIAALLEISGIGLPLSIYELQAIPTSFTGDFELVKNRVILKNGEGQISGSEFNIDLEFTKNALSNNRVAGELTASRIDLPLFAQFALNGHEIANVKKPDQWSKTNFGLVTLPSLDGEIDLKIDNSDLGLGDLAKNLEGQLALIDGAINLNEIKGEWMGGRFETNLSLTNTTGSGAISAQYRFSDIEAKLLSMAVGASDFIDGRIDILGDIEGSGRSPAAIVSSLTGSGTIDLKEAAVIGLNTSPLAHIINAVDQEGFEILDENVLPILREVIGQGIVLIEAVTIPYIVAVGTLRARNIAMELIDSDMVAAVEVDFGKSTINTQLSVRFDPGDEWVEGAQPSIVVGWDGPVKNPKRVIDVQPLSGYLSLRNFEREQRRVDLLQASILEKQRLRRDIIITNERVRYRQRLREEELRRQRQAFLVLEENRLRALGVERHYQLLAKERAAREEVLRLAREAEERRLEEEARKKAEIERKRLAEEERKRLAEEKRKAEVERKRIEKAAKKAAELERKRLAEEKRKAEAERKRIEKAAKKAAEIERKRLAEEERKRLAEEKRKAEAERKRIEEEAKKAAELERQRLAEEKRKAEAERKRLAEEKRKAEAERKRLAEEKRKAEAERKRLAEEKRKAEAERKRLAEEKRKAEAERKRIEEEAKKAAELERQRLAEEKRKAEAERERLAEEKRKAEAERKRIAEETKKAAELERKRVEAEALKAAQAAQEERERIAEKERSAEIERRRQEETPIAVSESERKKKAQQDAAEKQRQANKAKQLQLEEQARRKAEAKRIQDLLDAEAENVQQPRNNPVTPKRRIVPRKSIVDEFKELLDTR